MTKSRNLIAQRRQWSDEDLALLRERYPDTAAADLARLFGCAVHQVYTKAHALGLQKSDAFYTSAQSGRTGHDDRGQSSRFQPGAAPANKGLKRPGWAPGRMAETQFKKGHRSSRNLAMLIPVGDHRVNGDGYLDRKIRDDGPPQSRFERVHRLVWMESNGPIPAGHVVVFKPGQRTVVLEEITVDRLDCIPRAELAKRNQYPTEELREIARLRGAITRQINKRKKGPSE